MYSVKSISLAATLSLPELLEEGDGQYAQSHLAADSSGSGGKHSRRTWGW